MNRTIATATLGLGLAAQTIENAACEGHRVLRNTATLGSQTAFRELMAIWALCRKPGWDGNDAVPVERATLNATFCLLDSLPYGYPLPSIGAEPDGQLTLEWRKAPRRILSVSVDPDGYLHYAGLFGLNNCYGKLTFFSTAPTELLQLIQEL